MSLYIPRDRPVEKVGLYGSTGRSLAIQKLMKSRAVNFFLKWARDRPGTKTEQMNVR
jgi:hypothetical protein